MSFGHGGHLRHLAAKADRKVEDILDFSANVNPLGPPEWLRAEISRNLNAVVHYPDPHSAAFAEAVCRQYEVTKQQVVVGNGSTEILYALPRALDVDRAVMPVPCYIDYAESARLSGLEVVNVPLRQSDDFAVNWDELSKHIRQRDLVFLGQPNNPTGLAFDPAEFRSFASHHCDATFVIDEAFLDFVEGWESLIHDLPVNAIVLRSLTKFYAIPGLRLGFAVATEKLARQIRPQIPPWSVNCLAEVVGVKSLDDDDYARKSRAFVTVQREELVKALSRIPGLHVCPGRANYLLIQLGQPGMDAPTLTERLLADGIAIRVCDNYENLDARFFRVAVRQPEENEQLIASLRKHLISTTKKLQSKCRTPAIMFQGTSSNAGKSVLTAGLCRILLQDGIRVAPFKAQNMSLNSFVTHDGGEMGRAQVVQAQACRLEPDVRMNPVLLKPNSDTGSQVIVRGQPVGNMKVNEYVEYKAQAFEAVRECYDSLTEEYDAVVLEGAGSPGEVNLKHHDIVNMPMARYAHSPVLLVGDIDRGGVYASFVGTMEVLAEWERQLVGGFVVNRFRGDVSLLDSAHEYVQRHTGKPVLGVVPYLANLGLPQEDSVAFKSGMLDEDATDESVITIAVIDLPHISNFTDFDALRIEPDVHVRIVRSLEDLGRPDALVIPGSKNVLADLDYLQRTGLFQAIKDLAKENAVEVIGICGGFQMLGQQIRDPLGIESAGDHASGLGLLEIATTLAAEKTLVRVVATHVASGKEACGYEIHHGKTEMGRLEPLLKEKNGQLSGVMQPDHRIWGTYLHGIFDADEFRRWLVDRLRTHKGMPRLEQVQARYDLEPALDRLARVVREALPMERIYQLMGL